MEHLEPIRSSSVKQVEREIRRWESGLRILWNKLSERWEVWHFPLRVEPYFVVACEYEGRRLVPGNGLSSDTLLAWIRKRDNEVRGRDRAWFRRHVNEQKAINPKKKYYDDLDALGREYRRFENGDHAVQVPKTYWR